MKDFAERLKFLRSQKGLTQKQLASDLFLSLSSIAMYETGKSIPSVEVIRQMAIYFDISADYLLGLKEF